MLSGTNCYSLRQKETLRVYLFPILQLFRYVLTYGILTTPHKLVPTYIPKYLSSRIKYINKKKTCTKSMTLKNEIIKTRLISI